MVKCTSYLISKKLAEIGFKKGKHDEQYDFAWCGVEYPYGRIKKVLQCLTFREIWDSPIKLPIFFKSYDLETVLNALPMGIDRDDKRYNLTIEYFVNQKVSFFYSDDENELEEFSIMSKQDESLADTAARLLIQLHEAGLVKFKED